MPRSGPLDEIEIGSPGASDPPGRRADVWLSAPDCARRASLASSSSLCAPSRRAPSRSAPAPSSRRCSRPPHAGALALAGTPRARPGLAAGDPPARGAGGPRRRTRPALAAPRHGPRAVGIVALALRASAGRPGGGRDEPARGRCARSVGSGGGDSSHGPDPDVPRSGRPARSVIERLLGPVAGTAASMQWMRVDVAWAPRRHAEGYGFAASALELAPSAPGGWIWLARHLVHERGSAEREPDVALRANDARGVRRARALRRGRRPGHGPDPGAPSRTRRGIRTRTSPSRSRRSAVRPRRRTTLAGSRERALRGERRPRSSARRRGHPHGASPRPTRARAPRRPARRAVTPARIPHPRRAVPLASSARVPGLHRLTDRVIGVFGRFHYLAPFTVLLLCGLGLPLPEEVALIGSGLLLHQGRSSSSRSRSCARPRSCSGDSIPFWIGRHWGLAALKARWVAKVLHPERFAQLERRFAEHGNWVVFTCRFLPGLRIPGYFVAGTLGMSLLALPAARRAGRARLRADLDLAREALRRVDRRCSARSTKDLHRDPGVRGRRRS